MAGCGKGDVCKAEVKAFNKLDRDFKEVLSLQAPIGNDGDTEIEDLIPDERQSDPVSETERSALKEQMEAVLGTLSLRDRSVLKLRYGVDSDHTKTLNEIGNEFHLTHERIRQIEVRALKRVRLSKCGAKLQEFLG